MRGRFNITLSKAINDQLDQYASDHDTTRSAVIEAALMEYLKVGGITQLIHNNDLRTEVDDLTHRMKIIEEQITQLLPSPQIEGINQTTENPKPGLEGKQNSNNDPTTNHKEWYRQVEVVEMMPSSMNINTRKAKVSKAVSSGELKTNNKKGSECLIKGSSITEWIQRLHE
ncbi:MAG: hypothetical protein GXY48_09435 [Methanomicrobiales archaeon]|nr:hypothetical protein [Methanomicrobiales archaeon]